MIRKLFHHAKTPRETIAGRFAFDFLEFAYFTGPPFFVCGKSSDIHCGIGLSIR